MTSYAVVYEAFLAKILDDEWEDWEISLAKKDWRQILESALPWFKFPRGSLERTDDGFNGDLSSEEVQIIANYMKAEWASRCMMSWENITPLYDERDYSPANHLDKLRQTVEGERRHAADLESIYYRSIKGVPYDYRKLSGK